MNRSHKIRLVPNQKQLIALKQSAGTARYVYNWAKSEWDTQYALYKEDKKNVKKPSAYDLSKQWTLERPEWSKGVFRGLQTHAILNLGKAYINFWNGKSKHPTFHKKGAKDSFYVDNAHACVEGSLISLPCIGKVKMREALRFKGKIISYTVSRQADQWFVSIQVELPELPKKEVKSKVGIDVGINKIAVSSDGSVLENPKFLQREQKKLRRLQRKLARQQKGSSRRDITKTKVAKTHLTISNKRNDAIHKFTTNIAKNHSTVVIETLSIESMKTNKWMRRLLQDTAMREVHRQLKYKMEETLEAPQFFASSKTCSSCGHKKDELPCSVRVYRCDVCGLVLDRDLNAAKNLENTPWVTG